MIVILAIVAGAALGAHRARQRQGTRLDVAQYAAVYAIAFGLAAMFVTIGIDRLAR